MAMHTGHRARTKAEFLSGGLADWPPHRVMELLLFFGVPQGDVNPLAHELIDRFGSFSKALDAPVEELEKVPGMGRHTATLLKLIPATAAYYEADRSSPGTIVHTSEEAARILAPYFFGSRNEMVYILCLDGKEKVQCVKRISEGNVQNSDVSIRRIAEECMAVHASYFYLAHNHTSQLAFPSEADWGTTDVIRTALAPLGVSLLDHLIFVDGDVLSMKQTERTRGRQVMRLIRADEWTDNFSGSY